MVALVVITVFVVFDFDFRKNKLFIFGKTFVECSCWSWAYLEAFRQQCLMLMMNGFHGS